MRSRILDPIDFFEPDFGKCGFDAGGAAGCPPDLAALVRFGPFPVTTLLDYVCAPL